MLVGAFFLFSNSTEEISLDKFKNMIDAGEVKEIVVSDDIVSVKKKGSSSFPKLLRHPKLLLIIRISIGIGKYYHAMRI
jgi:hypothetical protein